MRMIKSYPFIEVYVCLMDLNEKPYGDRVYGQAFIETGGYNKVNIFIQSHSGIQKHTFKPDRATSGWCICDTQDDVLFRYYLAALQGSTYEIDFKETIDY
jgi:hypothetical protein